MKYTLLDSAWWVFGTTNDTFEEASFKVGENSVETLAYHEPDDIDNKHFVDIKYVNGSKIRMFEPTQVVFKTVI